MVMFIRDIKWYDMTKEVQLKLSCHVY